MSDDDDDDDDDGDGDDNDQDKIRSVPAVAALFAPPEAGGLPAARAIPLAQFKTFIEKLDRATELGYHKKTVKSAVSTAALAAASARSPRSRSATVSGSVALASGENMGEADVYKAKRRGSTFGEENTHALTGTKSMIHSERAQGAAAVAAAIKATPKAQGRLVAEMVSELPSPPSWVMRCDLRRLASLHSSDVHPLCLLRALRLADCARLFLVAACRLHRGRFTGLEPVSRPSR